MDLTILGSGTYQPQLDRCTSAYLVKIKGKNILFDFGRGTINQLLKSGVNYYDIDCVFITHTHADHFCEIGPFLHIALAELPEERHMHKPLTIYGPKGIKKAIKDLLSVYFGESKESRNDYFTFEVKELNDQDIVETKEFVVNAYSTNHSVRVNCLTYRLEAENKVLAYSGDSGDCVGLRSACKTADVAIIDTSSPEVLEDKDHLSGPEVGKIAQESKVKKVICVHIAPAYLKTYTVAADVKKFFKGEIVIGKDLMQIKI